MEHQFQGKWISNEKMANLLPRNVFHRQLDKQTIDCSAHRNQHILFRKKISLMQPFSSATLFVSADDYYKLYINGRFVAQGPAPSYHFQYCYNEIDVSEYLSQGENIIAFHTLYQGLINRVWQSGDQRHGLLCDLVIDGTLCMASDESFLVQTHSAYTELGVTGKHNTQFLERYDSRAKEIGFESPDFDDSAWQHASVCRFDDHVMVPQHTHMLNFEQIPPMQFSADLSHVRYDFGANYVGYLALKVRGNKGDTVTVRCGQELNGDGSLRYDMRANCKYEEDWILANGESRLDWFDYKVFRYAEIELPESATVTDVYLLARHYPFPLKASLRKDYADSPDAHRIWNLCLHTQKYGVQEVIQDCMDREKGFYLGDGCYTALTNLILTGDDSMLRKLIDDAFATSRVTDTLLTCMDCSFIQEIAEFPLILIDTVLWHYRYTNDLNYLKENYEKSVKLLNAYRRSYETDGLLRNLDKWCVVEWPANFRHGYDVDLSQGKICREAHVSVNAYYLHAVQTINKMAKILEQPIYRDETPLLESFYNTFYDRSHRLFRDGEHTDHVSLVGNSFVYGFGLFPSEDCRQAILSLFDRHGIDSLSMFCTFPMLCGLSRDGEEQRLHTALLHDGAWKRMLYEGATTTFEGWGKDCKWNTSLFHLTMSYAALFLADVNLKDLFG